MHDRDEIPMANVIDITNLCRGDGNKPRIFITQDFEIDQGKVWRMLVTFRLDTQVRIFLSSPVDKDKNAICIFISMNQDSHMK